MIGMAMFAILMCVNFASCSNDGNEVPEQGKEIMVSLGFSGDFEISESPLSRATSDDLYLIRVQKKNGSSYTSYAYGLFILICEMLFSCLLHIFIGLPLFFLMI